MVLINQIFQVFSNHHKCVHIPKYISTEYLMLKGTSSGKIMTEVGQFPVALIYGINMQTEDQEK